MERTLIKDTLEKIDQEVTIKGWVENYRLMGKVAFVTLRDRSGIVQCVGVKMFKDITNETVIEVKGKVNARPENQINPDMITGTIEIEVLEYKVLNKANPLPIPVIGDGYDIKEEARLKFRYLDLRRERMRKVLKLRSKLAFEFRNAFLNRGFTEVETPMLTASTKEGSRDFVVPSRLNPGKFYALPQSPQQYKQLLMTAGVENYFQLARCIRDEDLRADRGFEHTQIDVETSFRTQEEIMQLIESIVKEVAAKFDVKLTTTDFPRIPYDQAIEKYGADKFDMRTEEQKKNGELAFAWVHKFPFFKKVDSDDKAEVRDGKSGWTFTHNPFSMPNEEYLEWHLNGENIGDIVSQQYDLVCNGYEVGGGSVRAHKAEILRATYKIMGYSDSEIESGVGHMLKAFDLGTPPHGGIALGLDRLVMLFAGEESLKETIAFPMTYGGKTSVMEGPGTISKEQMNELGIKTLASDINDGKDMVKAIKSLLDAKEFQYEYSVHEETPTSEDSARVRGTKESEEVKAIILKGKKSEKNYIVNIPGNMRIDFKAVEEIVGEKVEMEKPEVIKERYGLIIGGVPPFGNLLDIPNYFDEKVTVEERSAFNCGLRTESIVMKSNQLIDAAGGIVGNFIKD
ncbi:MAG: amino acid--tRNA ligase-related protein [Candidatus Dojkabacteria bacterium]|nr:amino acid--tRNA ligase-related protein [Candidatus Dojkabacteria bacterium]MDQ7021653.1 amino acid--tRNA ligase-related protein [Candidatus Dojkabacteria bacterium]